VSVIRYAEPEPHVHSERSAFWTAVYATFGVAFALFVLGLIPIVLAVVIFALAYSSQR
jgi:hypothetical protein